MIKKLVKWGLFTFVLIMICLAIGSLFGVTPSDLKYFLGVKDKGPISNVIDSADIVNQEIYNNREQIAQAGTDAFDFVKHGLEDGSIVQGAKDIADKVGEVAEEQDIKGKTQDIGSSILDALGKSFNWFTKNGNVLGN